MAVLAAVLALVGFLACDQDDADSDEEKSSFSFPTRLAATPDPEDPDGVYLFAINYLSGTLTVMDVYGNEDDILYRDGNKEKSDDPLDIGDFPVSLAVSPDGDRVFFCGAGGGNLHVLDVPAFTTRAIDVQLGPCEMAVVGEALILADPREPRLLSLDLETESVTLETALTETPVAVATGSGASTVWVTTREGSLWRYRASDLTPDGDPVSLSGTPTRIAPSPGGDEVFVINRDPALLHRLDAQTLEENAAPLELPADPLGLLAVPDGRWVYIACADSQLYVYDRESGRACGASATVPEFHDTGALSDPVIEEVIAKDCVAREEEWTVTYDQSEREWVVEGERSDKQHARAYLDRSYVSDDGAIQFTIRSGALAPSDGDEFTFETDAGIEPIRLGLLPDGMAAVPDYDDPEFYIIWIANTLSDNLTHVTTDEHDNLGSVR